jgi:hypothetical protein
VIDLRPHPPAALLLAAALSAVPLSGQAPDPPSTPDRTGPAWNAPLALDLVSRARETRGETRGAQDALTSYSARAEGWVYFYLDRPDAAENTLVRTDQLALDVLWKAPGLARQRIVGRRDEKALPTSINYHIDHLSVVQDEFEDVIRIGDGDEVGAVIHPVAPGAERAYDYRVTDSLTLSYGGGEEVRVYELQVRPRRPDLPGFVGALYLDRERAAIVRMVFSFTPSSYVDPYLDHIRISLDNALWLGEYWLPYRQEAEVRRELPELDFLAGSVIRTRLTVGDYEFGLPLPDFLFNGPRVVNAGPPEVLEAFEFERGLYDDVAEAGLDPSPELAEVETQIREIGLRQALTGLAPVRLHLGGASDLLRYNRVEEFAVGAGTTLRLPRLFGEGARLRLVGGWSFGAERIWGRAETRLRLGDGDRLDIAARWDELGDVGPIRGASGVVNTLAAVGGADYLDPWRERSARVAWTHALGGLPLSLRPPTLTLEAGWARQASEPLRSADQGFPPVRPIQDGDYAWGEVGLELGSASVGTFARASLRLAGGEGRRWVAPRLHAAWRSDDLPDRWTHALSLDAGWVSEEAPVQSTFLLGGRETLPGHPYRDAGGDAFALVRARSGRALWSPWISGHLLAAAGWVEDTGDPTLPAGWLPSPPEDALRFSVGAGVDLLWEVLRLDLARGLPNGDWQLVFSVNPEFRGWL